MNGNTHIVEMTRAVYPGGITSVERHWWLDDQPLHETDALRLVPDPEIVEQDGQHPRIRLLARHTAYVSDDTLRSLWDDRSSRDSGHLYTDVPAGHHVCNGLWQQNPCHYQTLEHVEEP